MSWSGKAQLLTGAFALVAALSQATLTLADELVLDVPALGVSARMESIEVIDGSLGTPSGADNVGALQEAGNLLVVGHRDWSGQMRAFSRLETLQPGDSVEISDGRTYSVETTSVWNVDGEQDQWRAAVAPTHGDVLTLISCTGAFSVSRHEYLQRVVVRAVRTD